jgi:hypothetical protein
VGLERGPLSLVSKTEELLGRNSSGSGLENREYGLGDPLRRLRDTLYAQKLALTSPTCGGRSVGIVCLRAKTTEFFCLFLFPCSLDDTVWLVAVCIVTVGCGLVSLPPGRYSVARCGLYCYSWLCFGFPAACSLEHDVLQPMLLQLAMFWFSCRLDDTAWLFVACIVPTGHVLVCCKRNAYVRNVSHSRRSLSPLRALIRVI